MDPDTGKATYKSLTKAWKPQGGRKAELKEGRCLQQFVWAQSTRPGNTKCDIFSVWTVVLIVLATGAMVCAILILYLESS
jgi:hypothetical protein